MNITPNPNPTTSSTTRTRFAPSPTGFLHVGGGRTALFSWLYARQQQGTFILRIEDTDRERSTKESIQAILDGMEWLGIDYDEGPFYQTERLERYQSVAEQLIQEGKAYYCNCSKERLETLREQQLANKEKPRYDGQCRELGLSASDQHVIRFRNPQTGLVSFDDMVRGNITVNNQELDDLIIMRSDGMPTYNFCVVVDDWDMQITEVIRGDDHINNTPRQINILTALGAYIPRYAHVPMILGSDGKRLSKRHGAVSILEYREEGFLPQALLNYLVRLGWSAQNQEIFSIEEMIHDFNVNAIQRAPAIFNPDKLLWLNQHYMKTLDPSRIAHELAYQFKKQHIPLNPGPDLETVIAIQAERTKTLTEMATRSRYFYQPFENYDEKAAKKHLTKDILPALSDVCTQIETLAEWDQDSLHQIIINTAEKNQLKLGNLAQPIRVALTGDVTSPPIDVTLYWIGKEEVVRRLQRAMQFIQDHVR